MFTSFRQQPEVGSLSIELVVTRSHLYFFSFSLLVEVINLTSQTRRLLSSCCLQPGPQGFSSSLRRKIPGNEIALSGFMSFVYYIKEFKIVAIF